MPTAKAGATAKGKKEYKYGGVCGKSRAGKRRHRMTVLVLANCHKQSRQKEETIFLLRRRDGIAVSLGKHTLGFRKDPLQLPLTKRPFSRYIKLVIKRS